MEPPSISVVIPTYGRPTFLAEALRSVAGQSHRPIELIVVDDASSPPVEVPRLEGVGLRVVAHARNMGPGAARNTGMAHATGELLLFLDDDDLLTPGRLAWAAADMGDRRAHASAAEWFREDGSTLPYIGGPFDGDMRQAFNRVMQPAMGQVVHRRCDLLQFDPTLRVSEDKEWWIRMADRADFSWTSQVGLRIRKHAGERPGVGPGSPVQTRRAVHARHAAHLDRAAVAKLRRDIAGSAIRSGRRRTAAWWAVRSLVTQPSVLGAKQLGRAIAPRASRSGG